MTKSTKIQTKVEKQDNQEEKSDRINPPEENTKKIKRKQRD